MPRLSRPFLLILALLLALGVAACSPLGVLNTLTPGGASERTADLPYGALPRHLVDVYRPLPAQAHGPAPVVVFFYGGNWVSGERGDYAFVGRALAARGIVAMVADYRLYPAVAYPDFLTDAAQAVAWARRNAARFGGDPQRLFVMGHSAGAY
ncbi:MAG: alpha/beta hydrolase, partial [Duganella sp.]